MNTTRLFRSRFLAAGTAVLTLLAGLNLSIASPATAAAPTLPAPTSVTATPGNSVIDMTWSAPTTPLAFSGYKVQYSTDSTFPAVKTTTLPVTGTSAHLGSLLAGTPYFVHVAATNGSTTGAYSPALKAITFTTPSMPATPTVITGHNQFQVSWKAPATNGGTSIAGYSLQYSTDSNFVSDVTTSSLGTSTTTIVTGLPDGAAYYARIAAVNAVGTGSYSTAARVTVLSPASSSTKLAATGGKNSLSLTWTAPTVNGGSAITAYRLQYSTDSTFATDAVTIDTLNNKASAVIPGLINGTTYYVKVAAITAAGAGAFTAPVSAKVLDVLPAPSTLRSAAGVNSLVISWTAPASPASSAAKVVSYTVEYATSADFSDAVAVVSKTTSAKIAGLGTQATYYVRVSSSNVVGTSSASAAISATTLGTPSAATSVTAFASGSQAGIVNVAWRAPSNTGGSAITGYVVQYSTNSSFPATSETKQVAINGTMTLKSTLSGLLPGSIYYVRVAAKSAAGVGTYSGAATTTTIVMPTAPAAFAVTPTIQGLSATWSAPRSLNGRASNGYVISASTSPDMANTKTQTLTGTSASWSNLTVGATYYVTVAVKTPQGLGSIASTTVVPLSPVPAPRLSTPTGNANGSIDLTWSASNSIGGGDQTPIVGYRIQYSASADFGDLVGTVDANVAMSDFTSPTLTPGVRYYFRIAALSAEGAGAWSTTESIVATTTASAPLAVTATLTSTTSATLSWSAPISDGASAITGYQVSVSPDTDAVVTISGTTATITGLTEGHSDTFTVAATNANGNGASASSDAVLMANAPSAPAGLSLAIVNLTSLNASWSAATSNGSDVTSYRVQVSTDATFSTNVTVIDINDLAATLGGLSTGVTAYVRVQAVNAAGSSAFSDTASVKPGSTPEVVGYPTLTIASKTALNVSWTTPSGNGYALTGYTVRYSTDSSFATGVTTLASTTESTTLTGLTPGLEYFVEVSATNALGSSQYSEYASLTPGSAPSTPSAPLATLASLTSVTVTWGTPAANGYPITGYTVEYSTDSSFATGVSSTSVQGTSTTISGLASGSTYYIRVQASNALGTSSASAPSDSVTAPTVPAAASSVTVTMLTSSTATVSWNAPSTDGGSAVTGYQVTATPSAGLTITQSGTDRTASVSGFTAGSSYTFKVVAINAVGNSASANSALTLAALAPDAPAAPTATVASATSLNVSWNAPASNGSPISGYRVQYSASASFASGVSAVDTASTSTTLSGLTSGTTYYVRVSATNAVGYGLNSSASSKLVATVAPDAPGAVTLAIASATSLTISWSTPAFDGGSAITGYSYTLSTSATCATSARTGTTGVTTTVTLGALTTGTAYYACVKAINAVGTGSATNSATSLAAGSVPSVMTAPSVSIDGLTATLTWTAPASNGYPITGYLILPVPAIGSLGNIIIPSGSTLTTTISGLDVSTGYAFKILAKNALGNGTLSGYSSTVYTGNVPSTPVAPTVAPASVSTATVSWSAPAANNSPITGYTIAVTPSAGVTVTQPVGTAMSTTVSGLAAGTAYAFTVTATNAVGNSAASPSGSYTHPGSPGAPQALSATSGSGTASLVWTAPSTDGGSAITAYRIQYATNSAFTTGVVAIDTVSATLGQTIGGLTNGTLYYFRVAALNAIGAGTWTATSSGTPVAPTGVTDTTFATAGVLALTPVATAATYGPDGKLYVATAGAAQDNFYVTRYTSAGVVDTTYGTNGVASAGGNGGLGTTAYPRSLLIDKAGRAVVAGMCFYSYNAGAQASACVARFTTAGARDTAFATYGWTTLNFNGAKYSDAFQILIQSTGKIVAGGPGKETTAANAPIAACMTRLLDNGTVDTTFGTSGLTCTRPGSSYFGGTNAANFSSMALGPNDVIAVGSTFQLANIVPIVSKFTANGAYDTSFNGGYITDLGGAPYVQSVKVAFQSTGKIVFAVNSGNASTNNIVSLGRYTTAGVMDSTFSGQGVFFANGGTYNLSSYAENFLLTVEGGTDKIVFAQSEGGTEKVRRYSAAGVVDTTFGTSGILALPGTAAQSAGSVAVNPQGYYTFVGSGLVRVK